MTRLCNAMPSAALLLLLILLSTNQASTAEEICGDTSPSCASLAARTCLNKAARLHCKATCGLCAPSRRLVREASIVDSLFDSIADTGRWVKELLSPKEESRLYAPNDSAAARAANVLHASLHRNR